jgi:D-alanine-D-alanine ligase
VVRAATTAHRALGLRDLSRTDLIVDASGSVYFLEVNVAPGMTETSLLPVELTAADRDLGTVSRDLLARAVSRETSSAPGGNSR